jgi:hypothetical protein
VTAGLDSPLERAQRSSRRSAWDWNDLRRDLVDSRGLNPRPDLDEDHFYVITESWPASRGWREGSGQPQTNARLATFGKPVGPKFTAAGYAPFDDPEKMQPPKWLTKWSKEKPKKSKRAKLPAWTFDDERWDGLLTAPCRPETADGDDPEPVCRECWRDGITTYAVADPVRPWQREWRLCEDHSRAERRDRRHPRSTAPCAACGYIQWRHRDGTVYLEEVRPGCAIHEACWKAWTRERKQGTSWPVFAKARRIRVRARRILEEVLECREEYDRIAKKERKRASAVAAGDLMSLRHADPVGEISAAWRHYLERAIGRKHTNVVKLVLESRNGTVVPFGRPIAVPAPSHNGDARAASFVISSHSMTYPQEMRRI